MTALGATHCHGGHGSSILQSRPRRRSGTGALDYLTEDFDDTLLPSSSEAGGSFCASTTIKHLQSSTYTRFSTDNNHDSDGMGSCTRAHSFFSLLSVGSSKCHHFTIPFFTGGRHTESGAAVVSKGDGSR